MRKTSSGRAPIAGLGRDNLRDQTRAGHRALVVKTAPGAEVGDR